ncbi:GatA family leaderless bacteriocin [Bacillus sp. FSL R9-9481]
MGKVAKWVVKGTAGYLGWEIGEGF